MYILFITMTLNIFFNSYKYKNKKLNNTINGRRNKNS